VSFHKILAFIKRDLIIESSYKFAFVFETLTSVFPVLSFYFIARLVGESGARSLTKYGGSYFPFVMIGIAFSQYFMLALRTFAATIRRSQMAGCLEAMLSTRTDPQVVILLSSLYSFLAKLAHIGIVFAVAGLFLGVELGGANVVSAAVVLVLTVATFSSMGIFAAAIIVVLKKGDPIEWIFGSLSTLLGGALFPTSLLPGWARRVSDLLPITYALDAMRLAILKGHSLAQLWRQVAIMGGMSLVLLPISVWCFTLAVEKGRRDGTLMHY